MLVKFLPLLITGTSIAAAIALHWLYKKSFWLPSFLAASSSAVVSFILFKMLPKQELLMPVGVVQLAWNTIGFAFVSGFTVALLVGYLMKVVPLLFGK